MKTLYMIIYFMTSLQVSGYKIHLNQSKGSGQFGIVYLATDAQGQKVCAKMMNLSKQDELALQREKQILEQLLNREHKNLVNIYAIEYTEYESQNYIIIMMEYLEKGDLQGEITQRERSNNWFTFEQVLKIIRDIINGQYELFKNNIIHRDLKPANILIGNDYKIADFGMGRILDDIKGSPAYASPQIMEDQPFSAKTDIYSLGVIFYQLLFKGVFPFGPISAGMNGIREFLKKIKQSSFKMPNIQLDGDPDQKLILSQLIQDMLSYSEKDRPSWDRIMSNRLISQLNPQADNVIKIQQSQPQPQSQTPSNVKNKIKILEVIDIVPNNNGKSNSNVVNYGVQQQNQNNYQEQYNKGQQNPQSVGQQFIQIQRPQIVPEPAPLLATQTDTQIVIDSFFFDQNDPHFINVMDFQQVSEQRFSQLSHKNKVYHILKLILSKSCVAEQLDVYFDQIQLPEGPINDCAKVALKGYRANLILNAFGFSSGEINFIAPQIRRVYQLDHVKKAIEDFSSSNDFLEIKKQVQDIAYLFIPEFCQHIGKCIAWLRGQNSTNLNNFLQILQIKEQASYHIYHKWFEYFQNSLLKGFYYKSPDQKKFQALLNIFLNLEKEYPIENYFCQNPNQLQFQLVQVLNKNYV
ncbi:hypothetical protein pb186bvf_015737 [Paramecium bursaria]